MDFLKPTADHIARYVEFWIGFLIPPAASLEEFKGSGRIQPQLIIHLGLGILVAWIIGNMAGVLGLPDDPSMAFQAAKNIQYVDIPRVGTIVVFVTLTLSALAHGVARIWRSSSRLSGGAGSGAEDSDGSASDGVLGGNIYDTINAAMGFVAFFMPLGVLILVVALLLVPFLHPMIAILVPSTLTAFLILLYLFSSIAATHNKTTVLQAFFYFSGVFVLIALVVEFLGLITSGE